MAGLWDQARAAAYPIGIPRPPRPETALTRPPVCNVRCPAQGLFTDALASAERAEHVYPYTYLQSAKTGDAWAALRWPTTNETTNELAKQHAVLWRGVRTDGRPDIPARPRPRSDWTGPKGERTGGRADAAPDGGPILRPARYAAPEGHLLAREWSATQSLHWHELHPLPPLDALADKSAGPHSPGWLLADAQREGGGGGGRGVELMLAAPDWLYCTVPRWFISSGLAAMRPTHSCAILHLVECRSQFGSLGMLKAQRPHVQRAYGHWLLPPNASVTRSPLGAGLPPRALRLSLGARLASGADASILPLLGSLQLLGLISAISGRVPIIPSVSCGSRWMTRWPLALVGVADDYVIQLPATERHVTCHLAVGGHECQTPLAVPAWTPAATALETAPAARLPLPLPLGEGRRGRRAAHGDRATVCALGGAALGKALDALRAAARSASADPITEIDLEIGVGTSHEAIGYVAAALSTCAGEFAAAVATALDADERARLDRLRAACPGYFATPGHDKGQLYSIHRERLREKKGKSKRRPPPPPPRGASYAELLGEYVRDA